jgi:hypothetical protein
VSTYCPFKHQKDAVNSALTVCISSASRVEMGGGVGASSGSSEGVRMGGGGGYHSVVASPPCSEVV